MKATDKDKGICTFTGKPAKGYEIYGQIML